jgi:hypothetical protein
VLHSFGTNPDDGEFPAAGVLLDKAGNPYRQRTKAAAAAPSPYYGCGTVFEVTPTGEEKILCSFGSQPGGGRNPYAGLVFGKKENLFGATSAGALTVAVPYSN